MPEQSYVHKELNTKEKMVRGSMWMTIGSISSRLLGAIYIIPWYAWMGENAKVANALFTKGYNIYALFLMIATAGIPSAVAKQIAYYNSLNEYQVSKRLFKRSMFLMGGLGILFAGIMYFAAPLLSGGNKELIPTMRALSAAVLIFPCMSVVRGFFQGYQDMLPSAISQVVEQFIRVFYMLLATFIIMKVGQGDYVHAVTQTTFAAFVGMVGAFGALFWYYKKQGPKMRYLEANSNNQIQVSENSLIKEMLLEAVPFVIVGSGITIFKLVDQATFEWMMHGFTNYSARQLDELFSIFSANPDKLTMITISLATSLAAAGLPLITETFARKNVKELAVQVSDNLQLFFFVMIPATLGMIVLARPLNTMFYAPDHLGASVLVEACYVGLILGFYMLVSTILQGLYENNLAMIYLGIGFVVKVVLQYPLIRMFEVYGPLLATGIGFAVTSYLTIRKVYHITKFKVGFTARRTLLIFLLSLVMMLATIVSKELAYIVLNPDSKSQSFVISIFSMLVGVAVYGYLTLKVRLADRLLGAKVAKIRRKFKIK